MYSLIPFISLIVKSVISVQVFLLPKNPAVLLNCSYFLILPISLSKYPSNLSDRTNPLSIFLVLPNKVSFTLSGLFNTYPAANIPANPYPPPAIPWNKDLLGSNKLSEN